MIFFLCSIWIRLILFFSLISVCSLFLVSFSSTIKRKYNRCEIHFEVDFGNNELYYDSVMCFALFYVIFGRIAIIRTNFSVSFLISFLYYLEEIVKWGSLKWNCFWNAKKYFTRVHANRFSSVSACICVCFFRHFYA